MKRNRWQLKALWITFVLFLCVLCLGCASKEEKKAKHLERARQYIENYQFKEAVIELKNVVQLDPENDGAYHELGVAYLKLHQGNEAFQSFARAISINPDNLEAQLKIGQIFLLVKKIDEARKKAELVLEKSPDNIEALGLLSGVQFLEKDIDSAIGTLEKAASVNPKHFKTHLSLARLFLSKKDLDQSEKAYLKAISLDPASRVPYVELSRLYGTQGKWDKAESELKKMIQASGSKYQNLSVLARFYESRGKLDQAEKIYLEAVDSAPEEDVAPLMTLGAFYARSKSYDKALEAMKMASTIKMDDLNILVSIAQLHFNYKRLEDSEAAVDKVLEKDKGHVGANFLKGRLSLAKKDFADALERFSGVIRNSPRNAAAHYFKALSLIGKGERRLPKQDLLKAVELNPRLLDARLLLGEIYLRERAQDLAREQIESALKQAPGHITAIMLQGNLKTLERDTKGAEAAFKKVVKLDPQYAPGHVSLGLLYYLTGRQGEALKGFRRALELDPEHTSALALMVGIYVRAKKFDEAIQACEKMKEKIGENPAQQAQIEYLEGNISLARTDSKTAQHHFEKAINIDPNIIAPYLALARMYTREKRLEEAISQFEAILSKNPKYLAAHMALGAIYDQKGDGEKAESYYRKALQIKGDFAPAANNLAWNLVHRGGNVDEALGLAQIAKEKMPKSTAVMSTLGYIYYLKGSYLNAVAELEDSLKQEPDNPIINYHLGLAYYKNNQPDAARECLEKALKIDQHFKGSEEARSLLKEITSSAVPK